MVTGAQRFRKASPCPICGGYDQAPRGKGVRGHGFLSDDGVYAHCSREEHSGALPMEPSSGTYAHRLLGDCRCGVRHDPSPPPHSRNGHHAHNGDKRRLVATYNYTDAEGQLLYQVVRYRLPNGDKTFTQRRPDGQGGWIWGLGDVRRVLYRGPEVVEAIALGQTICAAEGEADVEALRRHGYAATCNSGGAEHWTDDHSTQLAAAGATEVVLFGDNDEAGRRHVAKPVDSLRAHGLTPRLARLDGLPEHGDVRDWLKTHRQEDLDRVIVEAPPAEGNEQASGETPSSTWHIFSLEDALQPREPRVEIVQGLFPLPNLSIVYGAPGVLKTFFVIDMLICIAAEIPWLSPLGHDSDVSRKVQKAPILFVDFDNGPRRTHERIAAVARGHWLSAEPNIHYVSMPQPWLNAGSGDGLAPLQEAIERCEAKAVVIDNLLLIKGAVDENSAEMGSVMARLRQLTERYKNLIIPVHHQRKENGQGRTGDRLRGHSSIEAALDLALLVERDEGSSEISIRSTKTRDVDVPPFSAIFSYEHEPGTDLLYSARFYGIPTEDEQSDHAIRRGIREVLTIDNSLIKMALCGRVQAVLPKVGVKRIKNVIDLMVRRHHLICRPGERGAQHLSLPL